MINRTSPEISPPTITDAQLVAALVTFIEEQLTALSEVTQ